MVTKTKRQRATLNVVSSLVALSGLAGFAHAADIDTGNSDVSVQWGNTIRYNIGVRQEGRNPGWEKTGFASSEAKYGPGDVVVNRADMLSEVDFSYKGMVGFRVAAAAWYDGTFDGKVGVVPGREAIGNYVNNTFSDYTKRYFQGPSAEVLDAYVFGNTDVGGMPLNVKVGRQTNLWGEATVISAQSISNQQQPIDGLKATSSPGIDNREVQLPTGQVHATLQVNDVLTLAAMYQYEWQPTRIAESGTYLASSDLLLQGPDRAWNAATSAFRTNLGVDRPNDPKDWGLSARYKSEALDAVVGVYIREYSEKGPTVSLAPTNYRAIYPTGTKLLGFSLGKLVAGTSVGAELSYRKDAVLASTILDGSTNAARGNTWHALVNANKQWGPNYLWDQMILSGELAYSALDGVTENASKLSLCSGSGKGLSCKTKSNTEGTFAINPSWIAVKPGWDLSARLSLTVGLDGNGVTTGGASEGAGSWSLGGTATLNNKHDFTLTYADALSALDPQPDRGWVSFTYRYSF